MTLKEKTENPKKILYVEDKSMYRDSISLVYKRDSKLEFETASTKEEGLEKIANKNYDVVMTDGILEKLGHDNEESAIYAMKRDGLEIAKAAKAKGSYVIGFSSDPDQFSKIASEYLNININKPKVDLEKLRELLHEPSKYKNPDKDLKF